MATTSELLDRAITLFNENRLEETEDDYAPGAMAEEIGTGRRLTPAENTANTRQWKQAFPDATGRITNKIIDGNRGVAEVVWQGTNSGALMGNPPTGQKVTVRAVFLIETNGSKVTRSAHYIDIAGMMAQLGARQAV
jgi:steroid delta-isomerase-like uncharacterized protein